MNTLTIPDWVCGYAVNCVKHGGGLPMSMEMEDIKSIARIAYLESACKDLPPDEKARNKWLRLSIRGAIMDAIGKSYIGPSSATKCERRRKGLPVDYGEVRIDTFANEDGELPFACCEQDDGKDWMDDATLAGFIRVWLAINRKVEVTGISSVKRNDTRQAVRFHLDFNLCGKSVFLGQYDKRHQAEERHAIAVQQLKRLALDLVA